MNKAKLKTYAPAAREEFIKAVTERAAYYGISKGKAEPCKIKGDFAFIAGRAFPKALVDSRKRLVERIEKSSFSQVMEEAAYTWFNRIAAIRFMEINGYLSHGYRVLSHPEGHTEPEILEKAQFLDRLDGLEKDEIIRLKTAPDKESELYRKIIIAQCNELNSAMPFLFEKVDDPTELLLPDNLLNTDSVIRHLVNEIPEEDWEEVEIIGWLYQFYISEKKDALMKAKKAYKTEDIPAVTQLFTPNWIVKYLVQNSLGAKWLSTYPVSGIKAKMEYYIEPAPQDKEVEAKLKEITPLSLNPEDLTVMDPACGSGHILVEAYNLLKEIYLEKGYRAKDIPALILTKNVYGLEIDDRAAQLAGFAVTMKARADDREIFKKNIKPNIICLKSAKGIGAHLKEAKELIELFDNAETFGSLIRVPEDIRDTLPQIRKIADKKKSGDIFEQKDAEVVIDLLRQAELLSQRYDCVVANPPYMGGRKYFNATLKEFATLQYPDTKADLFAMFIERSFEMAKDRVGYTAMVTMQSWMFLLSFEKCREFWLSTKTLQSMAHLGARAFSTISGEVVTVTAFSFVNVFFGKYKPSFLRLVDEDEEGKRRGIADKRNLSDRIVQGDFQKIPGSPVAYWASENFTKMFAKGTSLDEVATPKQGMATGDNEVYVRVWGEVDFSKVGILYASKEDAWKDSQKRWFPYNKGGEQRKWYGNNDFVLSFDRGSYAILKTVGNHCPSEQLYFKEGITWGLITSGSFSCRYMTKGFIFDVGGSCAFPSSEDLPICLAFLNTKLCTVILRSINPTLNTQVGDLKKLPILIADKQLKSLLQSLAKKLIEISKTDWDSLEISWDFVRSPILMSKEQTVYISHSNFRDFCKQITDKMKELEEENNRLFIEAYGLKGELVPDVPIEEITLFANPKYRYKGELTDDDLEARFKADTMKELISYSIGCMMGRYSLDVPGLVYAHAENKGFDSKKYKTFPADDDGIIPITEREWFDDDAACRFFRFIEVAWEKKGLDENLDFIAEAIGRRSGESSRDTIRRYLANDFFKDHMQTYKNRPIYWLFSSGKQQAFQALVYLHRYNEGTLSRMRTEYVLPLQTKIARQIEHLEKDKDAVSGSTANKIAKEIASLRKQAEELRKFDEVLRHYADKRIKVDLDDGVKVNYGKFGNLLAEVKKIAGSSSDE